MSIRCQSALTRSVPAPFASVELLEKRTFLSAGVEGPIINPANGHAYYIVAAGSWTTAQAEAQSLGGNLATIRSAAENAWIVKNMLVDYAGAAAPKLSNHPAWIGLYDPTKDANGKSHVSNFVWASGAPVSYTNWNLGEPSNSGGNEYYTTIDWHFSEGSTTDHSTWNDSPLSGTKGYGGTTDGPYFGIAEVLPRGTIVGTVYSDSNANGKVDAGEAGFAGVKLYIDANKNGKLDPNETTTTANAAGAYKFTGLPAGAFRVREVMPIGYKATAPTLGFFDVTLAFGNTSPAENFLDAPTTASISGRVYADVNANGLRDSGEPGLGLFTVYIDSNNDGVLDAGDISTTTDVLGNFKFTGLTAGSFTIRVAPVTGVAATKPIGGVLSIKLTNGQSSINNLFGERAVG